MKKILLFSQYHNLSVMDCMQITSSKEKYKETLVFSPKQAAEYLDLSYQAFGALVRKKVILPLKGHANRRKFGRPALLNYINGN